MLFFLETSESIPLYYGKNGLSVASDLFFHMPVFNKETGIESRTGIFIEKLVLYKKITSFSHVGSGFDYKLWEKDGELLLGFAIKINNAQKRDKYHFLLNAELTFGFFSRNHFIKKYRSPANTYPITISIQDKDQWLVSFFGLQDFYWKHHFGAMLFALDNITKRLSCVVSDEYYSISTDISIIPLQINPPLIRYNFLIDDRTPLECLLKEE